MEYFFLITSLSLYFISFLITLHIKRKYGDKPQGISTKEFIKTSKNVKLKKMLIMSRTFYTLSSLFALAFFIIVIFTWL